MNYYEFNLLITPDFSEEQVIEFCDSLIKDLKKEGEKANEFEIIQRKLAYPIEKESEAWLTSFYFLLKGEDKKVTLSEVEKLLKSKKEILRHLILAKKELKKEIEEVIEEEKAETTDKKVEEKAETTDKKVEEKAETTDKKVVEEKEEETTDKKVKEEPEETNLEKVDKKVEELLKEEE